MERKNAKSSCKEMIRVIKRDHMAVGCDWKNKVLLPSMSSSCKTRSLLWDHDFWECTKHIISFGVTFKNVFFSSDFIKLWFVKCLKILQNKVENVCEISFLCDCYSYDYRGSATISLWGLEEKNWQFHLSLIEKTDVTWTLLYIFCKSHIEILHGKKSWGSWFSYK